MKKKLSVLILVLSLLSVLNAASLYIFPMTHAVYDEMDALYTLEGLAAPLGARPWSEVDVQHMLDDVSPETARGNELKEKIQGYVKPAEKDFNPFLSGYFNPTMLVHSNPASFSSSDDAFNNKDILNQPLLGLDFIMTYRDNIAALIDLSVGFNYSDALTFKDTTTSEVRYNRSLGTNIFGVSEGSISLNFPTRAYVALGTDFFRFTVGRDRLSWGNGLMGNVILGDTLPYHDAMTLTFTGSPHFTYQMLVSFFTHTTTLSESTYDRDKQSGIRFMLGHRFEMRFLEDKLKIVLNEAIMYASEDGYIDPRIFNPVMILHSLYIAAHSNSIASLEMEYAPVRNLSFYFQWAVDDLALGGEPSPGEAGGSADAWALQGGARYTIPLSRGFLFGNTEIVYTNPYAYHRASSTGESADLALYFISSLRSYDGSVKSVTRYLSYPFGSDTIAALTRFGYDSMSFYRVQGVVAFMAHGIMNKYSTVTWYKGGERIWTTPSTENPFDENEKGEVEYTLATGVEADFDLTSYLSIGNGLYLVSVWNKDNNKAGAELDLQFSLSAKLYF